MDFSLGLRLGSRNKRATNQRPPAPSAQGLPVASCPACALFACAGPCPGHSCTAYPSCTTTCPSCPSLPGPPCACPCPPCPARPPLTCPHVSCIPCSGPHLTCCPSPCPVFPHTKGRAVCLSSCVGCCDSCVCGPGASWGPSVSNDRCCCCFRGQRTSQGRCLIV
ncbi:uncharacterized LOC122455340 homolog [Talpa occidentalis]|uniref:uncharacterized LOC122455340 homolog n=1 Tax=Talpa occidentalis TaxID=50954 RepID=UPI0023F89E12|nr:uncharacterized LOC122455340 homolog [Talpa occidentalis]